MNYGLKNGLPDPATIEQDKMVLTAMVEATMESWHGRKISPVYQLLPNLQEPQWKALRIGDAVEFWQTYEAWAERIDLAQIRGKIGDLLVLADEAPVSAFRAEAHLKAGVALRKAEHFGFALEQLEQGLTIEPDNLNGLREQGICLQRLALCGKPGHSLDKVRAHYRKILGTYPNDMETWALLGRVDKDAWVECWHQDNWTAEQMRDEAGYQDALLRAAIENYRQAFRRNPGHYYSGINALTLMHLYRDLGGDGRFDVEAAIIAGAVRFAAECETDQGQQFWSKATLGDLEVLIGTPASVTAAYKEAIARPEKDWFALNSTLAQLCLLSDLGFRQENVDAGIAAFERALQRLAKPEYKWQPRKVFLFSGHMVDAPNRTPPRFPEEKVSLAADKIAKALAQLNAGSEDLALTQGACGGDILFAEACLQRGVRLKLLQPFEEAVFIEKSVLPGGESWRIRYFAIVKQLQTPPRAAPLELGHPRKSIDPYERCNLWLLYTALIYGIDKVYFICLWNGEGGDGFGGTAHMYKEVNERTGQVYWVDTRKLLWMK